VTSDTANSEPRKAKGTRKSTSSSSKRRGASSGGFSLGREIWLTSCGVLGILIGLVFFALCAGFWYGSGEIVKIIAEINERDFTVMSNREKSYEVFFGERDNEGYRVSKEDKIIYGGEVSYMWRVQPPGSSEIREFGWKHDLELNTVSQTTNGALLLDLKLGVITEEYARTLDMSERSGSKEIFNPDDNIAAGIVNGNLDQIAQGSLRSGWDDGLQTGNGVLPPLMSLSQANDRKTKQLEEMKPDEEFPDEEENVEQSEDVVDIEPADGEMGTG